MAYILTLVSSHSDFPLKTGHLELAQRCLDVGLGAAEWLADNKAVACHLTAKPESSRRLLLESELAKECIDVFINRDDGARRKKLLVADMDNTVIVGETLDELAVHCGLKDRIAAITERAMRGEMNFQEALRERVAMLAGLEETALASTLAAIQPTPGARELITTMRGHGAECVLVSGGFTYFTEEVAGRLGFNVSYGNILEVVGGRLTGKVLEPIIDYQVKERCLQEHLDAHGYQPQEALAIGDGANDLAMLLRAGMGVGFHPKPYLRERVENSVVYGDLTCLLYIQGYRDADFLR